MLFAFSGGASNGHSFAGMVRTCAREGLHPTEAAGISAGALNALFVSLQDWPPDERTMSTLIAALKRASRKFLKPWYNSRIVNLVQSWFWHDSVYRAGSLFEMVRCLVEVCPNPHLVRPLTVGVWDSTTGSYQEKRFREGTDRAELTPWVVGSASLPLMFPPVKNGERVLRDGGLEHEIPVEICAAFQGEVIVFAAHCLEGAPVEVTSGRMRDVGKYLLLLRSYEAMLRDLKLLHGQRPVGVRLWYPMVQLEVDLKVTPEQVGQLVDVGMRARRLSLHQWVVEREILAALRE